jgi:hypothetical protein
LWWQSLCERPIVPSSLRQGHSLCSCAEILLSSIHIVSGPASSFLVIGSYANPSECCNVDKPHAYLVGVDLLERIVQLCLTDLS